MYSHNDSLNYNNIFGEQVVENYYYVHPLPCTRFYFISSQCYLQNVQTTQCFNQNFEPPIIATPQQSTISYPSPVLENRIEIIRKKGKTPRKKTLLKQLQSAKKNSESNIVNQLYSFFNSFQTSKVIVQKTIKKIKKSQIDCEKIRLTFYNIVRCINLKRGRNYVNKKNILKYYTPQNFIKQIPEIAEKLKEIEILTLDQFCYIFRVSTVYFLKNISPIAILTSKRISVTAKIEHLKRKRRVFNFMIGKS